MTNRDFTQIKMRKPILLLIFVSFILFFANYSFAGTKTWSGTTSTSWTVSSNWVGGVVPASGDDILIPGGLTNYPVILGSVTTHSISINSSGTGASLTITAGGALSAYNITVNANGTFTVISGTVLSGAITTSGNVNVQGGTITSDGNFTVNSDGNVTQSGGLIHMASNTSNVPTNHLVINGGIVTQSGGTFYIKDFSSTSGNFNQTGSSALLKVSHEWKPDNISIFNSSNGTVEFTGTGGGGTTFVNTNTQFYNIVVDAGADPFFDDDNSSVVNISGNFTNNNSTLTSSDKATFIFNGTGTQTLTSSSSNVFTILTINKISGTVLLVSGINVLGTLNMTAGNITTGANIITLGTSTSNLGTLTYNSGTIITGATGGFTRWFKNSAVSNVIFPVGTSSTLNTMTLSFTSAPTSGGTLTAKYIASDPGTNSTPPINDNGYTVNTFSPTGYWQIVNSGITGGTYTIGLNGQGFNIGGVLIFNYQLLRVLYRVSSSSTWQLLGTHVNGTGTNNNPTASRSGLSVFNQYAYGGNMVDNPFQSAMPVELTSFAASIFGRDVKLNWVTATETNNSGFEIQRSMQNENNWEKVGFVKGNGTKNTPTNYTYTDSKLNTGKYQYRLKQIDYNGNYEYFLLNGFVNISNASKYDLSQNYPNPFNPVTNIDYELPQDSKVMIKVYDISGRVVSELVNLQQKAGFYTIRFNASNIASGNYFYQMITNANGNSTTITKRMVVIK
ncbi:MAG TPA: T9SS type A sorting domain-containing protein [Ignavibacteria bacterium]